MLLVFLDLELSFGWAAIHGDKNQFVGQSESAGEEFDVQHWYTRLDKSTLLQALETIAEKISFGLEWFVKYVT